MKVTKIEPQKHNKNRYSIYVDDKFAIGVDREIVWILNLREEMEVETSMLDKISYTEERRKVKERALHLLTYRARSKKELIDRLKEKGAELNIISDVIEELETIGLVKDTEFAELWVRERSKSYGTFRLRSELIKKGIAKEIIDKTLEVRPQGETNELDTARSLAQKWIDRHKNLAPDVLKRRLYSFLMRRGISYDTISSLNIFGDATSK
ncbi:MAG: RecX family transcriptional regulator [Candidatus Stahlbacteria bacterium]|nr:RecX family transcriptional regulator [Candidatus Stahlbacteria bacterium]